MTQVKSHTRNINGKVVAVKQHQRKDSVLTAKDFLASRGLTPPLSDKTSSLPITFAINVLPQIMIKIYLKKNLIKELLKLKNIYLKILVGILLLKQKVDMLLKMELILKRKLLL